MIVFLGIFYLLVGVIILFISLLYLELSRPRDLIKAGLNLFVGTTLIIKNKIFDNFYSFILILITFMVTFFLIEIFSSRWNQLTDKEKNKFKTFSEFIKNLNKFYEAIYLGAINFFHLINIFKSEKINSNTNKKKWVRDDNMDSSEKKNSLFTDARTSNK